MPRTIKVGVIGSGGISRVHLEGYQKSPYSEVLAVCDIDPARAKQRAEQFDVPYWFDSADELLKLREIQAVSICTPNYDHKGSTLKALRAGKHVLCEKPIAMNAREGQQMVAAAKKARKKLQIGLHMRFSAEAQYAKKVVEEGLIGKPYYARSLSIRRRGVPSWGVFGQKKLQGGGPLIDIGVHAIDLTWYLMGCPKPVAVAGKTYRTIGDKPGHVGRFGPWDWKTYDVEDFAVALIRFDNGATMTVESAFCVNLPEDVLGAHVVGDKGGVATGPLKVQVEMGGHLVDCTPNDVKRVDAHHAEVMAFVDAVVNGKAVPVPGEQALWVQKIIDAIYRSSEVNRELRIR
ncbi:MAG: hypothetical protein B1H04_02275 [Planctomycetales bacterium 4484_123]|nr:MAG: hypothetical protein B1H04_02275 [Planctomycetales bacterium 4484_123]